MKVLTLKRAAGYITFEPGEELDLPDDQAQELIACGAVVSIEKPPAKPVTKPKKSSNNQGE
jgi:hypothetical protein